MFRHKNETPWFVEVDSTYALGSADVLKPDVTFKHVDIARDVVRCRIGLANAQYLAEFVMEGDVVRPFSGFRLLPSLDERRDKLHRRIGRRGDIGLSQSGNLQGGERRDWSLPTKENVFNEIGPVITPVHVVKMPRCRKLLRSKQSNPCEDRRESGPNIQASDENVMDL